MPLLLAPLSPLSLALAPAGCPLPLPLSPFPPLRLLPLPRFLRLMPHSFSTDGVFILVLTGFFTGVSLALALLLLPLLLSPVAILAEGAVEAGSC